MPDVALAEPPLPGATLAAAIAQTAPLWSPPAPAEVQRGTSAVCGGRPPVSVVGVQLWPVLPESTSGPALVLADIRRRIHVVVDVTPVAARTPRPGWVAASGIVHAARLPGSHPLWRHWQFELADHAAHEPSPACDGHVHLARPNAQGRLQTGLPQHDAWMMSRSWLPAELALPSTTDVRWVVLSSSDRPLRLREPSIHGTWDAVSYAEFAAGATTGYDPDEPLPASVAALLDLMAVAPPDEPAPAPPGP